LDWQRIPDQVVRLKYRDLLDLLLHQGWTVERTVGSHMQLRHPNRPGTVTVPAGGKLNRDVPPGTLGSVLKQAGLKGATT
jgi:predicted RNA binding protein YcfA (HicA-like mRNA interferase family)